MIVPVSKLDDNSNGIIDKLCLKYYFLNYEINLF